LRFNRFGAALSLLAVGVVSQPGSYPIVLATYEIVCSKYPDAPTGTAVKAFLQSAIGPGQKGLADDGNVPLPDDFKLKLSAAINAIA
jgi:phosphate transport system substrate-binding protein